MQRVSDLVAALTRANRRVVWEEGLLGLSGASVNLVFLAIAVRAWLRRTVGRKRWSLIINLSLSDFVVSVAAAAGNLHAIRGPDGTQPSVETVVATEIAMIGMWSMNVTYLGIAAQRYLAVRRPFFYRTQVTLPRCFWVMGVAWIIGLGGLALDVIMPSLVKDNGTALRIQLSLNVILGATFLAAIVMGVLTAATVLTAGRGRRLGGLFVATFLCVFICGTPAIAGAIAVTVINMELPAGYVCLTVGHLELVWRLTIVGEASIFLFFIRISLEPIMRMVVERKLYLKTKSGTRASTIRLGSVLMGSQRTVKMGQICATCPTVGMVSDKSRPVKEGFDGSQGTEARTWSPSSSIRFSTDSSADFRV